MIGDGVIASNILMATAGYIIVAPADGIGTMIMDILNYKNN